MILNVLDLSSISLNKIERYLSINVSKQTGCIRQQNISGDKKIIIDKSTENVIIIGDNNLCIYDFENNLIKSIPIDDSIAIEHNRDMNSLIFIFNHRKGE